MMHGHEKSDHAIVAVKPANKAVRPSAERSAAEPNAAEPAEPRAGTEGNACQQSTRRTQCRESVSQALERIRKVARERKKEKFTALLHHISVDLLEQAFFELKEDAAPGVDGLTWPTYEADLDRNLTDLHERVHRGAYRALPSRRMYVPKPDGRQRPIAIAALEDKIVKSHPIPTPFSRPIMTPYRRGRFALVEGAETGGAEPHIAEQSRSWRARSGAREITRGS